MINTYRPSGPTPIQLSPEVREILGRVTAVDHQALTSNARFLVALGAKSERSGSPVFGGIPAAEKAKRRRKARIAKASRKANR